jgi:hypothetical protein
LAIDVAHIDHWRVERMVEESILKPTVVSVLSEFQRLNVCPLTGVDGAADGSFSPLMVS